MSCNDQHTILIYIYMYYNVNTYGVSYINELNMIKQDKLVWF